MNIRKGILKMKLRKNKPNLSNFSIEEIGDLEEEEVFEGIYDNERDWDYWREQLAGELPVLKLATDSPRRPLHTYHKSSVLFKLNNNLTNKLKKLCHEEGVSLHTILLAAYQVFLSRYSGQEDIIVGIPVLDKGNLAFQNPVDNATNILPIRANLSSDSTFFSFLNQVKQVVIDGFEHQNFPLPLVIERLQLQQDASYAPLVQTIFVLQNHIDLAMEDTSSNKSDELTLEEYSSNIESMKYDLILTLKEVDGQLCASLEYRTDLFQEPTVIQMLKHFQTLLECIVANPRRKLSELSYFTGEERHQLLVEWNHTPMTYPKDIPVHVLFEAQVEKTPDAIAVVFGEEGITYRELNEQANQLAHYLQEQGVKPETLVGICVERSVEMVIGILGIVKAGGAYVPMDPMVPQERLVYIIEDAQISFLLTQERLLDKVALHVEVICLDTQWNEIAQASTANPVSEVTSENLAYVIYTSGSTGKPKGVAIAHRSLVDLIFWHQRTYEVTGEDRATQLAGTAFDASVWEIWPYLTAGSSLYIPDEETWMIPDKLRDWLIQQEITISFIPTPMAEKLIKLDWPEKVALRFMLTGGDQLHSYPPASLPFALVNHYGPSENTVVTTAALVPSKETEVAPPIGRPIANTEVYVLDAYGQPVPVGVVGELYIGGDGLARGYLNRPELTEERFVSHPFSTKPGARLYRTGDLVRYLRDGNLEFHGRIDHQVKIRGFRIELGEIEVELTQHPAVKEAVVIAKEDELGEKRLVAYLVTKSDIDSREWRRYLKTKLPEYMIPTYFVRLDSLPLTPNVKVDRRGLPDPNQMQRVENEYVAPRNSLEKELSIYWAEVLGIEQIGVEDNFFEMGGHSLLATQLVFRICEALQLEIPLRALFEQPTIFGMVQIIEAIQKGKGAEVNKELDEKDLRNEVELDSEIDPQGSQYQHSMEPRSILLTGATGFLGAFLLHELIQQTEANIYCLIRALDQAQGEHRIKQSLEKYGLWNPIYSARIVPVVGDLSQPLLGLSDEQFNRLAEEIDVIYHNGALVNYVASYLVSKGPNVVGTQEVLRLACRFKLKPVHHISTLSVFSARDDERIKVVSEDDLPERSEGLSIGYPQSKWVAEQIVEIARLRGIPVTIYRLGRISGHSETGACQEQDMLWRMMKGYIQLGIAPQIENAKTNLMPVDWVSRAIVYLSHQKSSLGENFHLFNPHQIHYDEIFEVIRSLNYPLRQVPAEKWMEALQDEARETGENALAPLVHLIREGVFNEGNIIYHAQKTTERLREAGICYPIVDADMVKKTLTYFIETGFLKKLD